jgi:hypothetical protein
VPCQGHDPEFARPLCEGSTRLLDRLQTSAEEANRTKGHLRNWVQEIGWFDHASLYRRNG